MRRVDPGSGDTGMFKQSLIYASLIIVETPGADMLIHCVGDASRAINSNIYAITLSILKILVSTGGTFLMATKVTRKIALTSTLTCRKRFDVLSHRVSSTQKTSTV
jgi:lysylphosphatidylglycerol synthetase-like protein (DUF2156 family)